MRSHFVRAHMDTTLTHALTTTHIGYATHIHTRTQRDKHTLLTSSPCGLVKRQFAACSKAKLRLAAASQVTNWQGCSPLLPIVKVGVFTAAT